MAGPQAYDWRELLARLELSGDRDIPSTLDHAPTRRVLHSNMLHLRNANLKSMHKISFKSFPEKRWEAKFVPFGIWRMMFFRRLAWVRMNETSPDIAAALRIDLNGLPTTENMVPDVFDNGTDIEDGNHDNFIDLFLPIDEIWNRLGTPTNQQWIQDAVQQDKIRFRNLDQLRTILQGTNEPSFRHIAFTSALDALFHADGSPISNDPFKFLQDLMNLREQIVADLAVLQDLHENVIHADMFLDFPDDIVSRMERLAGPGVPSNSPMTNQQQGQLHPRVKSSKSPMTNEKQGQLHPSVKASNSLMSNQQQAQLHPCVTPSNSLMSNQQQGQLHPSVKASNSPMSNEMAQLHPRVEPSNSLMTNQQQAQLHPRVKSLRDAWNAASLKTRGPRHKLSMSGPIVRQRARLYFNEFMKDQKATERTLAEMDLWI